MPFDQERAMRMASHADDLVRRRQFAGIAWSVDFQGQEVAAGCVGHADAQARQAVHTDTLYRLYSMTKPVVSVLCLQLIEAGRLRLDDPIARYLPAFATPSVMADDGTLQACARPLTVEDLLTHRAGLSYDFLPACPVAALYREAGLAADGSRSLQALCDTLAGLPLALHPGTRWYYSYGTDVLAALIERLLDRSLGEAMADWLFEPLAMSDTAFRVAEGQQARLSAMFGQRELGEVPRAADAIAAPNNPLLPMDVEASYPSMQDDFARGGIGLFSTLADYRRFMQVLIDGRAADGRVLLSAPMLDLCWQNRLSDTQMPIRIGDKAFAGYGWNLTGRVMADTRQAMQLSSPGEGGWAGAASTWFWIDRRRQLHGLVMAQYLGSEVPLGPDMQALAYAALS